MPFISNKAKYQVVSSIIRTSRYIQACSVKIKLRFSSMNIFKALQITDFYTSEITRYAINVKVWHGLLPLMEHTYNAFMQKN